MSIEIVTIPMGMTMTNTYLVADSATKQAVVIDPGGSGERILAEAENRDWEITAIWLTHGHFDHLGGAGSLAKRLAPIPPTAIHPDDLWLWESEGGAGLFGIQGVDAGPKPSIELKHGQELELGVTTFEVRHAPGHTPGHVMFYCEEAGVLFCGDVIFRTSIGRTDLPKGNHGILIKSIQDQVLTLPDETRLLNGHGPETTVGFEKTYNPFLG